jgi:hypothetical protein
MSNVNENEYNALIDTLKNMADVVLVLSNKLDIQDNEIIKLKHKNLSLEENLNNINNNLQNFKLKTINFSNAQLKTEEEYFEEEEDKNLPETNNNLKPLIDEYNEDTHNPIITEPTTIGETDIERVRKYKAIQLVDKLIKKKKEISNLIENNEDKAKTKENKENKESNEQTNNKQVILAKRKNKIMKRF